MNYLEIKSMGVISKNKAITHRIEVEVEFNEPVSYRDAEQMVSDAIGVYLFDMNGGNERCS